MQAHQRLDAVVLPARLRTYRRPPGAECRTPRSGQQRRRAPVGFTGKSDDINFIAGDVIGDHEAVAILYDFLEPEPMAPPRNYLKKSPSVPTPP